MSEFDYNDVDFMNPMFQQSMSQSSQEISSNTESSSFQNQNISQQQSSLSSLKKISSQTQKRVYTKKFGEKVQRWTQEECLLYEHFIEKYQKIMKDSGSKRNTKIFLFMSQFIGKTPSQCRSHHQKFYRKTIKKLEILNNKNTNYEIQNDNFPELCLDLKQNNKVFVIQNQNQSIQNDIFCNYKENKDYICLQNKNTKNIAFENNLLKKALFIDKMIDQQQNINLNEYDYDNSMFNCCLTPQMSVKEIVPFDINDNFSLIPDQNQNQNYENNLSWKKIFGHIEKVENSIQFLKNIMSSQD